MAQGLRIGRIPGTAAGLAHLASSLAAALAIVPGVVGCKSLGQRAPAAADMASCRQLQQNAHAALERGEAAQAELLLSRAVAACPVDAEARREYADALWQRGAHADALSHLEQARIAAPDDAHLAVRAGEMLLTLGRPRDAWFAARDALDIDPQCGPAWAVRGRSMAATGQWSAAAADYQRALGYEVDRRDVLWCLAEAQRELAQPEQALATLEVLGDIYPPNEEPPQLLVAQGMAQAALGRFDDARNSVLAGLRRGPPSAEIWCRLAEAELGAGRADRAAAAAGQALALEPAHPSALALAARLAAVAQAPPSVRR